MSRGRISAPLVMLGAVLAACQAAPAASAASAAPTLPARSPVVTTGSLHTALEVETAPGVQLEVLDWGGTGPLLLLLAGMGNTAHIFDDFAPAFVDRWHVVGLTRRGFGASTLPPGSAAAYDVPTLGKDILRVLDAVDTERAILVGHSVAGEELTWLASEHPERVSALVYLDAAYDRVYMRETGSYFSRPDPPTTPADLESPQAYAAYLSRSMEVPVPLDEVVASFQFEQSGRYIGPAPTRDVIQQIMQSIVAPDYARIQAPTLALYALADYWPPAYAESCAIQRERFALALPRARLITIPHASHYLFLTHRNDVVRYTRELLTAPNG